MNDNGVQERRQETEKVNALIDDRAIFCGRCGHKVASTEGLRTGLGNGKIILICKHKDGRLHCNTPNVIEL